MSILCINDKTWKYEVLQGVHNVLLIEFQDISRIFYFQNSLPIDVKINLILNISLTIGWL